MPYPNVPRPDDVISLRQMRHTLLVHIRQFATKCSRLLGKLAQLVTNCDANKDLDPLRSPAPLPSAVMRTIMGIVSTPMLPADHVTRGASRLDPTPQIIA